MILENLRIKKGSENTRVSCDVDGENLYYSFPNEFAEYTTDSFDCFALSILPVAMRKGEDLIIKGSVSEKLWFNIQNQLIPSTPFYVAHTKIIRILPDNLTSEKIISQNAVGAGLSCGVDSLCSLEDHYFNGDYPESFKITHATNFCVGAAGTWKKGKDLFYKRLEGVREYISHTDLKLLPVLSNVADIHSLVGSKFIQTYNFRNMAVPMLFPKLFSKYYLGSTVSYRELSSVHSQYKDRIDQIPPGLSDSALVPLMSTENMDSILVGAQYSRPEKTLRISKNTLAQRFLDVCISSTGSYAGKKRNCSKCEKCLRTLVTLDFYGMLQNFEPSFDLDIYKKYKGQYLKDLKKTKHFDLEIINLYSLKNKDL